MVSASQLTNTLGAVIVFDGANPRTFTAKARETISGGYLVLTSGASGDVGSSVSSYVAEDITVFGAQDLNACNGIALNNAGSNDWVTVATRGAFLIKAYAPVSGGYLVQHNGSGNVGNWITSGVSSVGNFPIGRAMTTAGSGTNSYSLISLNL